VLVHSNTLIITCQPLITLNSISGLKTIDRDYR